MLQHIPKAVPGYHDRLLTELPFQQLIWKGKEMHRYACSIDMSEVPKYPVLTELIAMTLSQSTTRTPKGVWCNWYRNGEDYTPYHKDSYNTHVVNISCGATRDFCVKKGGVGTAQKYQCEDGDLIIFDPVWNAGHTHAVPARKLCKDSRISVVLFCI